MVANQQPTSAGFPSSQGSDRKSSPYAQSQPVQQAMSAPNPASCKFAVELVTCIGLLYFASVTK
jgi:hypothetical protein